MASWCSGITTAHLHSTKPKLRFCAGSNPTSGVSEVCDDENSACSKLAMRTLEKTVKYVHS